MSQDPALSPRRSANFSMFGLLQKRTSAVNTAQMQLPSLLEQPPTHSTQSQTSMPALPTLLLRPLELNDLSPRFLPPPPPVPTASAVPRNSAIVLRTLPVSSATNAVSPRQRASVNSFDAIISPRFSLPVSAVKRVDSVGSSAFSPSPAPSPHAASPLSGSMFADALSPLGRWTSASSAVSALVLESSSSVSSLPPSHPLSPRTQSPLSSRTHSPSQQVEAPPPQHQPQPQAQHPPAHQVSAQPPQSPLQLSLKFDDSPVNALVSPRTAASNVAALFPLKQHDDISLVVVSQQSTPAPTNQPAPAASAPPPARQSPPPSFVGPSIPSPTASLSSPAPVNNMSTATSPGPVGLPPRPGPPAPIVEDLAVIAAPAIRLAKDSAEQIQIICSRAMQFQHPFTIFWFRLAALCHSMLQDPQIGRKLDSRSKLQSIQIIHQCMLKMLSLIHDMAAAMTIATDLLTFEYAAYGNLSLINQEITASQFAEAVTPTQLKCELFRFRYFDRPLFAAVDTAQLCRALRLHLWVEFHNPTVDESLFVRAVASVLDPGALRIVDERMWTDFLDRFGPIDNVFERVQGVTTVAGDLAPWFRFLDRQGTESHLRRVLDQHALARAPQHLVAAVTGPTGPAGPAPHLYAPQQAFRAPPPPPPAPTAPLFRFLVRQGKGPCGPGLSHAFTLSYIDVNNEHVAVVIVAEEDPQTRKRRYCFEGMRGQQYFDSIRQLCLSCDLDITDEKKTLDQEETAWRHAPPSILPSRHPVAELISVYGPNDPISWLRKPPASRV